MGHYNKALKVMPCAVSEPANGDEVKIIVDIARLAGVKVGQDKMYEGLTTENT
jgi:hypothetical protein